jgi:ABC-type dipeptide/oligopeptide/nickel transport system ATPase component
VVAQVATRVAVMRAGQFVESGPVDQVPHQPTHAYTRELLAAVPELPAK